jgi:SSS family solute:Na+ symporter
MLLSPVVCTVVFFLPISVGVMGRLSFPDLVGKQADRILPMVLTHISGDSMAALVMAAGLAALMSTMDSQLLTLSSIFTRDILPGVFKTEKSENSIPGRIFVFVLSLAGLALAYNPPDTILQIAAQTFTGLAVLFPTVIFALYLKRVYALSAFLSIIVGESLVVAFYLKWISPAPFLPVVWVIAATFLTYLLVHGILLLKEKGLPFFVSGITLPGWLANPYSYVFIALFALAMDFWGWGKNRPAVFGLPLWMGYFVVLSALQTVFMYLLVRNDKKPIHADSGSG